ncbi:MAG: hypothetical protein ACK2UM_03955 [Anaerolineales bacterium]
MKIFSLIGRVIAPTSAAATHYLSTRPILESAAQVTSNCFQTTPISKTVSLFSIGSNPSLEAGLTCLPVLVWYFL